MKLVIFTQVQENYGAHDWDGIGECPKYWKAKGGEVYVVENVDVFDDIVLVRELTPLIETANNAFMEYIAGSKLVADDAQVCQPWETVTTISKVGDKWVASALTKNDEYGCLRKEIASSLKTYTLTEAGKQDYKMVYTLRDGRVVPYADIMDVLAELDAEKVAANA